MQAKAYLIDKDGAPLGTASNPLFITGASISGSGSKVKVSSTDSTTDYLLNKLVAGANVSLDVLETLGVQTIRITSTGGGGSTSFASLTDVDLTGVENGQVFGWNDGVVKPFSIDYGGCIHVPYGDDPTGKILISGDETGETSTTSSIGIDSLGRMDLGGATIIGGYIDCGRFT